MAIPEIANNEITFRETTRDEVFPGSLEHGLDPQYGEWYLSTIGVTAEAYRRIGSHQFVRINGRTYQVTSAEASWKEPSSFEGRLSLVPARELLVEALQDSQTLDSDASYATAETLGMVTEAADRAAIPHPYFAHLYGSKMNSSISAACTHCDAKLALVRDGTQTATIKDLVAFLEAHRGHRENGDVVVVEDDPDA